MNNNVVYLGSQIVLNVCIELIDGVTARDYDFDVEVYCAPKRSIVVKKQDLYPVDDSNFLVLLNTEDIGTGNITCKVTAMLPDGRFAGGLRKDIELIRTDINIVKA